VSSATSQPEKISEVAVREPLDPTRPRWIDRARSADHKIIGTTMIGFALVNFVIAGFLELLCQIQLAVPSNTFLSPERFYSLHTLSDTGNLYLFALPLLAGIATYVLPLQIGARSTAFPRLSALGLWMFVMAAGLLYLSTFINTWQGTVQTSAPLFELFYSPGSGADFWLTAVALVAGGLTFNAIDLAVTFRNSKAIGMSNERTPIFAHSAAVYSYGILVTAPVAVAACLLALIERQWVGVGIFNPVDGGSPLLWKALFQWWSHSAPLLALVLAIGAVTEIFATAASRTTVNLSAVKKSLAWFAALGILSFGTVFFGAPVAPAWNLVFMVLGLAVVIPSFVIMHSWHATLKRGDYRASVPASFALVFAAFFVVFLIFQVALSLPGLSQWINGSQAGYMAWLNQGFLAGGFGGFAALLYWFPKFTGRSYSMPKMRLALTMITLGVAVQFLALFSLGMDGFPREASTYTAGFEARNIEALIGLVVASLGVIGVLIELIKANSSGLPAGNDPWHAGTLEWFAPSPPPSNNFDSIPPVSSERPLSDLRDAIASETGTLVGSVAQSPTAGRPSLRESKH
jgi:cytochrome c oxidase subunit 1